jgi:hypothetical protein
VGNASGREEAVLVGGRYEVVKMEKEVCRQWSSNFREEY